MSPWELEEFERETFEKWAGLRGYSLERRPTGPYKSDKTNAGWRAWRAACEVSRTVTTLRESIAPEGEAKT